MQQVKLVNQITKTNEASFRPGLVYQQHRSQVAHPLHVADIGPEIIESAKNIFQRCAEAVHFFKKRVQVRERSRNILQYQ